VLSSGCFVFVCGLLRKKKPSVSGRLYGFFCIDPVLTVQKPSLSHTIIIIVEVQEKAVVQANAHSHVLQHKNRMSIGHLQENALKFPVFYPVFFTPAGIAVMKYPCHALFFYTSCYICQSMDNR